MSVNSYRKIFCNSSYLLLSSFFVLGSMEYGLLIYNSEGSDNLPARLCYFLSSVKAEKPIGRQSNLMIFVAFDG